MESDRFDALTRTLYSRRTALTGVLGGVAALLGLSGLDASAHNLAPACQKLADPVKRRKCLARARRHKRQQHSCKPRPLAVTCANRCGRFQNNCRKAVNCTCAAGKTCLINKGCNSTCSMAGPFCPAGCTCGAALAENSAQFGCFPSTITECAHVPVGCTSTAHCPVGHFCGLVGCGPLPGRCFPNCQY